MSFEVVSTFHPVLLSWESLLKGAGIRGFDLNTFLARDRSGYRCLPLARL